MQRKEINILKNSTLLLLSLIPILSTIFFHNHITTLIEVIWVFFLLLCTLIIHKNSRSNIKWLILYYLICFIYLGISYYHSKSFVSLVPGNFDYNIFKEFLTILKLIMPITLLYVLIYQNITYKEYIKVLKWWGILIFGSIIITNIFKISLGTYSDTFITKNIFSWYSNNYYQDTASKGYFMYANQISAISIMLLLIYIYDFLYNNKNMIYYIIFLGISMLMIGSRVSSVGGLLVIIVAFIFYIIYKIYKKEKISKRSYLLLVPIIIWIILIPISPYTNRNKELNGGSLLAMADIDKSKYVYDNYNPSYLPKIFFEKYYPIEYDEDFWYEFINKYEDIEMNYRLIEESIIKRVIDINNNKKDLLWGISNTRIQNIVNIERDFVLHFYAFGIIGSIILLFIYIYMLLCGIKKFFKYQTYSLFILCSSIILFIYSSYLTGNIINSLNATIPFIFINYRIFCIEKG